MFSQRLSRLRCVLIGALSASAISLVLAVCPAAYASPTATAASHGRTARTVVLRASRSGCTPANARCYRYIRTYQTYLSCGYVGVYLTGSPYLFKCVPLPPSGHYELWVFDSRL